MYDALQRIMVALNKPVNCLHERMCLKMTENGIPLLS